MTIPQILHVPDNLGDKTAIIQLDIDGRVTTRLSYEQLTRASHGVLNNSLTTSLRKGDIAALFLPNSAEFVVVTFVLLTRGIVVLPLNPALKLDQITGILTQINPAALIGTESNTQLLHTASKGEYMVLQCPKLGIDLDKDGKLDLEDFVLAPHAESKNTPSEGVTANGDVAANGNVATTLDPGDPALLLFTSGTTSVPKGVLLTHRNLLTSIEFVAQTHHVTDQDTCMLITPLFHVSGFCTSMLLTLVTGGTLVIQPPGVPSSSFWQQVIQHRITWFHVVPALLKILLKFSSVTDFRSAEDSVLRFMRCSGSPLSDTLLAEAEATTGKPLLEIYGLTETSSGICCQNLDGSHQAGTFPVPSHAEVKIVLPESTASSEDLTTWKMAANNGSDTQLSDLVSHSHVGEVCIRGPNVITEYVYSDPASDASSFDKDGFFHTGDLARRVGPDGSLLQLMGRLKEVVNKGGEKINPNEVDNVIVQHGDVTEAACFAAPDEEFGEDICVAIIVNPSRDISTLKLQQALRKDLRKFLRRKLIGFQIPRDIHFVNSLPKTAFGKYKRRELTAIFSKPDLTY